MSQYNELLTKRMFLDDAIEKINKLKGLDIEIDKTSNLTKCVNRIDFTLTSKKLGKTERISMLTNWWDGDAPETFYPLTDAGIPEELDWHHRIIAVLAYGLYHMFVLGDLKGY